MEVIEEKNYKIKTDKNNEMDLFLRNINNKELSITLFTINKNPSKKYELKCNLEEFQKNRFFKIFINIQEIMKELDNKILKSTFIEETNSIIIDIQIGLTIINELLLVIEEKEKNKDEIIKELIENNNKLKNDLEEKNKQLEKEKEIVRKIYEEKEKAKKEKEELFKDVNYLEKKIKELKDLKIKIELEKLKKEEKELKSN